MLETSIKAIAGTPVLHVNGAPTAPVIICGVPGGEPDMQAETARLLAPEGIHLYTAFVDFVWAATPAEEEAQRAALDAMMRRLVEADPRALFMPRFGTEPKWWVAAHPEEAAVWAGGHVAEEASMASARWMAELKPKLTAYVRWFEENWGDHVFGYQPCACGESYYMYWWNSQAELPGFDVRFAEGFRAWLRQRYGGIAGLNAAWHRAFADFAEIRLPTAEERWASTAGLFRDPAREQALIDFTRYGNEVVHDALHAICRTVKEACNRRKLTIICYGYLFEMAGNWHGYGCGPIGHCVMGRVLRDPEIDAILAPASYADRQPGGAVPWMGPVDTPSRFGKAWVSEIDIRTHLSPPDSGFGRCATAGETEWVHTQAFSQALVHRAFMWFMDMGGPGGWLKSERIAKHLGRLREQYQRLYAQRAPFASEVVAVVDDESHLHLAYDAGWLWGGAFLDLRQQVNRIGTTPEWRLLGEFADDQADRPDPTDHAIPRLVLMLNAFCLTSARLAALRRRFENSGATVVWFYAPGHILDGRLGIDGMRRLTGFEFEVTHEPAPIRVSTRDCASSLLAGLDRETFPEDSDTPIKVGGPASRVELQMQHVGTRRVAPRFSVRSSQPGNEVVARFEDGSTAIARRQEAGFTSVYVGTFWVPAKLLANLANEAGCHLHAVPGTIVTTDGRVMAVASETGGPRTITLPRAANVRDALSASPVVDTACCFELTMEPGECRLLTVNVPSNANQED